MTPEFSHLELQLIRSSLSTRTDEEISDLLERPLEDVRKVIDDLTDGQLDERQREVKLYKQELANRSRTRNRKISQSGSLKPKMVREEFDDKKKERTSKRQEAEAAWHRQRNEHKKREDQKSFQTRHVDLSDMHSLRIDDKTTIFWRDSELEEYRRETKKGLEEFIKHLHAKYESKFETKIEKFKTALKAK